MGYDNCPRGYLHDGKSCKPQNFVTCDPPKSTAVALRFNEDTRCIGILNGYNSGNDKYCKTYVYCRGESVVNSAQCPDGQLFDISLKHCVLERETICNDKRLEDNETCRYLQDGLHVDPLSKDCKKYRLDNLCKGKSNALISDPRSGCTAYIRCVNDRAISFHQCMLGQVFDVVTRTCKRDTSKSLCKLIGKSNECSTKEFGFYQDRSVVSSCREYFFCYNGFKTNFRCELGKLFNGENCVDERLYTCPNKDPNSCDDKADGYYK